MNSIIKTVDVLDPEVVGKDLVRVETEAKLNENEATRLRGEFGTHWNEIVRLRGIAAQLSNPETDGKLAKETRLGLKRIRCEVEVLRKRLKERVLLEGRAIDGYANVIKYMCEPAEEALESIEKYAERKEAARIQELIESRTKTLIELGADPGKYQLGSINDESWQMVLNAEIQAKHDREAKARAAEEERIRVENENRIAREKAEADAKAARDQAEKDRKAKAQAEAEAKKANDARIKAEKEAAAAKKREEDRLAAEAKAKADEERKAKEDADRIAALPDMARLQLYIESIQLIDPPEMTTEKGRGALRIVTTILETLGDQL